MVHNTTPRMIAQTTDHTDYIAVIFTSVLRGADEDYESTAGRMMELAARQPGFLGVETARSEVGITVSYWKDEASVQAWRLNSEHTLARERGRSEWYDAFQIRICRVMREYGFASTAPK